MFQYKINCLKFKVYKIFRMFLIVSCILIMFLLTDAISKNFNLLLVFNLLINFVLLAWLGKTSIWDKIYTKDGIRIKRVK